MAKWESEKHKSWGMPAEGFKGHVATVSYLLGTAGMSGACGWSVVQLDSDEELGPLHGMYGSMEVELEVQRIIKRAELTAFLCLLKKVIGAITVHVDSKGIIDGLWRGERKCKNPKAGDADLWIEIWEELHSLAAGDTVVEVARRKERKTCRTLECAGPTYLSKNLGQRGKLHLGGHDMVRRMDRQGEVLIWCGEMFSICEAKNGTEIDEVLQAGASGHQRVMARC